MRLSIDTHLVLDAIDRKGSFAAAAHELNRVPSAITYTLQKLEEHLDALLFDRRGHRAALTAAGQELLTEGRHILRAAGELEAHVKRVATGWEAELRITAEVFGGCWDALASGRADLVIGASGDGPAGGGYTTSLLGEVEWVFAISSDHPLANATEPIRPNDILAHRAVVVADSSRNLPPPTASLLTGQETLTAHNMAAKLLAQRMGQGVGHLPRAMAEPEVAAGNLIITQPDEGRLNSPLYLAWRSGHKTREGKALAWWVKQVSTKGWLSHAMR